MNNACQPDDAGFEWPNSRAPGSIRAALAALDIRDRFLARLRATADPDTLAELMAEAIRMDQAARRAGPVRTAGDLAPVPLEQKLAATCLDAAEEHYTAARQRAAEHVSSAPQQAPLGAAG
jgi:hypothetical protein